MDEQILTWLLEQIYQAQVFGSYTAHYAALGWSLEQAVPAALKNSKTIMDLLKAQGAIPKPPQVKAPPLPPAPATPAPAPTTTEPAETGTSPSVPAVAVVPPLPTQAQPTPEQLAMISAQVAQVLRGTSMFAVVPRQAVDAPVPLMELEGLTDPIPQPIQQQSNLFGRPQGVAGSTVIPFAGPRPNPMSVQGQTAAGATPFQPFVPVVPQTPAPSPAQAQLAQQRAPVDVQERLAKALGHRIPGGAPAAGNGAPNGQEMSKEQIQQINKQPPPQAITDSLDEIPDWAR